MPDSEGSRSGGTDQAFQYHIVRLYQTLTSRLIGAWNSGMLLKGRTIHVRFSSSAAFNHGHWFLGGINLLNSCGSLATDPTPNHRCESQRLNGAGGSLLRSVGWL